MSRALPRYRRTARTLAASTAIAALAPAGAAFADGPPDDDQWHVALGAGVMVKPLYPGSSETETRPLPFLNARRGRFFIGQAPGVPGLGVGYDLVAGENFRAGAALGVMPFKARDEGDVGDDPRLRGLGDIDGTVYAGFYASYTVDWFELSGSIMSDAGGKDHGTVASLDAEVNFQPTERLNISFGPGVTWSNAKHNRTFYGVDAVQAARSGLALYTPDAGASEVRFSLGARYQLGEHWMLGARATAAQLQGDAKDSPIVGDKQQNTYGVFAAYQF
jgi:outer membrane protein